MCEYCNDILDCGNKWFDVQPQYGRAWISEDCGEYELCFEIDDVVHMAGFKIDYCPKCGRKLS